MDIMEEIMKKRRGEEITKESVSEIMKEMAPDMTQAMKDYAPVIDQVIQDFGVSSEYGIYEEDGHIFMCIPTSFVDLKNVDGYTYSTEGEFTVVQLDALNKDAGCASASTGGMSNAVYSKKVTEKSKVKKSYDLESIREMLQNDGFEIMRYYEKDGYMSFILNDSYSSDVDERLTGLLPTEFTSDSSRHHIGQYNGGYTWVKLYK